MKSVMDSLLERRSIRRYQYEPVAPEKMQLIYEAIRNTPTSYNGQQFSVVAVDDPSLKEQLYKITGQKQIKTCSHFLVFCLDYHKLRVAASLHGEQTPAFERTIDGYTVGVIDASLAMMSAVTVAESLGLGCCCIGYTRTADPHRISTLLGLPSGVSIVCGLAIGHPRETPDLKPKLPQDAVIHTNHYTPDLVLEPLLRAYDDEVTRYNLTRAGDQTHNDWSGHIAAYHRESMTHGIGAYLREQIGLDTK